MSNDLNVHSIHDGNIHALVYDYFKNNHKYPPIGSWDVSKVTKMGCLFYCNSFNEPLNNWDVSNVTSMESMFAYSHFNQPLDKWKVGKVVNMKRMFHNAMFNQPIGNWDVSNVISMESMFAHSDFNQPLDKWKVGKVVNMERMFRSAMFNQPIGNWDVSNVSTMEEMFKYAIKFNQPLNNWNVSCVKNMDFMFVNAVIFNQPLFQWDVSQVCSMTQMFYTSCFYSPKFNQNLNNWQLSNIKPLHKKRLFPTLSYLKQMFPQSFNPANYPNFQTVRSYQTLCFCLRKLGFPPELSAIVLEMTFGFNNVRSFHIASLYQSVSISVNKRKVQQLIKQAKTKQRILPFRKARKLQQR